MRTATSFCLAPACREVCVLTPLGKEYSSLIVLSIASMRPASTSVEGCAGCRFHQVYGML